MTQQEKNNLYGVMLEFQAPEPLIEAAKRAYSAGFREMDAFTPYPLEAVAEAIGFREDQMAPLTLLGGVSGGILAFGMQWYSHVIDYPMNVGGRPDFSWPSFIPVTFELTVLGAALSAGIGMLALNRLPKLWHPVFHLSEFSRASRDRFFLCIQAKDPLFDPVVIRHLVQDMDFLSYREVKIEE